MTKKGTIRILLLRRRRWTAAMCLCLGLLMLGVVNYPAAVGAAASARQLPIYCVQRDQKMASLTFDAAWGNEDTQQLIDILGKYGVKATFFVVGQWAEKYPESVRALHEAGHEVMNHSDTHPHLPKLSDRQIMDELNACNDKVEAITGVRPTLIRPPYGDYDDSSIRTIRAMGMEPIQWDVDSLDWKGLSAPEIVRRVTGRVCPGSIVLFHNAAQHTPEALPDVIETLLREGYTLVPVSQLILTGAYTIDHTGRQCPA